MSNGHTVSGSIDQYREHRCLPTAMLTGPSIERLFLEHRRKLICRLYRIVRCKETAIDLAQETYLRLVAVAGTQPIPYPRAFLFRTATNLALDHLRKEKTRIRLSASLDDAAQVPSELPSAERALFDKQRFKIFLAAIDALPSRCREVFLLHRVHDYTYGEIAARLGISESAVEKNIMRALLHCRRALQDPSVG